MLFTKLNLTAFLTVSKIIFSCNSQRFKTNSWQTSQSVQDDIITDYKTATVFHVVDKIAASYDSKTEVVYYFLSWQSWLHVSCLLHV